MQSEFEGLREEHLRRVAEHRDVFIVGFYYGHKHCGDCHHDDLRSRWVIQAAVTKHDEQRALLEGDDDA